MARAAGSKHQAARQISVSPSESIVEWCLDQIIRVARTEYPLSAVERVAPSANFKNNFCMGFSYLSLEIKADPKNSPAACRQPSLPN